jgi:DNA-3-methyladenine glycosylase II
MTVQDLAARFADARLSTEKLMEADDEELTKMLIEVRGIGKVCHVIFLLRSPDLTSALCNT